MKALLEIWDFIAGSSIVAPIGVAVAIIAMLLPVPLAARSALFLLLIFATFIAASYEKTV